MNRNKTIQLLFMITVCAIAAIGLVPLTPVHADGPAFPPKLTQIDFEDMRDSYEAIDQLPDFKRANSVIKGGFGFVLGEEFDPTLPEWGAVRKADTDLVCYLLQAPKPLEQFSHYAVWVSEGKNRIYIIMAAGFYDKEEDANRRFEIVSEALGKKYGPKTMPGPQSWQHSKKMVMNAPPELKEGKWRHIVFYVDLEVELDGQVEKELEEIDLDAL